MAIAKRVTAGLIALALCGLVATAATFWERGYRVYVIHTGSMIPTYHLGDVVIDKPAGQLHRGEVITFRHSATSNVIVTHRINSIVDGNIRTKGDANPTPDAWSITSAQVKGVVAASAPRLGYVVVFFKQPAGIGAVMTGAIALILLWDLFFRAGPLPTTETATGEDSRRRGAHRAPRRRGLIGSLGRPVSATPSR